MLISIEILGLTLTTIGEIILAGTVLSVHQKLKQDHGVDDSVIKEISLEQIAGIISIILIITGYFFQINFFEQLHF